MEPLCPGGRPEFQNPAAMARLLAATRIDSARIREMESRFGPLDWRVPETLAIYWAYQGTLAPRGRGTMLCQRILYQTLATSFFRGTPVANPEGMCDVRLTRTSLAGPALAAFSDVLLASPTDLMEEAASNFVHDAMLVFNAFGDTRRCDELFALLHKRYPHADLGATPAEYCAREPDFVARHAQGAEPLALVEGYLDRHCRAVVMRDSATSAAAWGAARKIWESFEKNAAPPSMAWQQLNIPTFGRFARAVFERSMATTPPPGRHLLESDWKERMGDGMK
jgi:hypothetical protein